MKTLSDKMMSLLSEPKDWEVCDKPFPSGHALINKKYSIYLSLWSDKSLLKDILDFLKYKDFYPNRITINDERMFENKKDEEKIAVEAFKLYKQKNKERWIDLKYIASNRRQEKINHIMSIGENNEK